MMYSSIENRPKHSHITKTTTTNFKVQQRVEASSPTNEMNMTKHSSTFSFCIIVSVSMAVLHLLLDRCSCIHVGVVEAFQSGAIRNRYSHQIQRSWPLSPVSSPPFSSMALAMTKKLSPEEVKSGLKKYLQVREEAKQQSSIGDDSSNESGESSKTVVGGTRGNVVLEFVSGAPVKEWVVEQPSNIFDYDELSKYGFSHLVTPIMELGGRPEAYRIMEMPVPTTGRRPELEKKSAPKLVIDRTGENDKARYSGLKINQVLDDDLMAQELEKKRTAAVVERPKLEEEFFERPFSDKRNTGPQQTPDWTVERLDEWGRKQGKAQAWARKAKMGEFVKDPAEVLGLPFGIRLYAVATLWLLAIAFGRSTPTFFVDTTGLIDTMEDVRRLMATLEIPASALGLANFGSAIVCSIILAPQKNRSPLVWGIKGLFGGPVAVRQLVGLEQLITFQDQEDNAAQAQSQRPE